MKLRIGSISAIIGLLAFLMTAHGAFAACDLTTSITYTLPVSYSQLCGVGEVTIRVTHPGNDADLTDLIITGDLGSSGLTYVAGSTSFAVRSGPAPAVVQPGVAGPNGSVLTWNLGNYILPGTLGGGVGNAQYLDITFRVQRAASLSQEGLVSASRTVQATVSFATINERGNFTSCTDSRSSGPQELPIRQPLPAVTKAGRNVDAAQGGYSDPVYGNNQDDVIWRLRIENRGNAALQDLRISDVMETGNFDVTYRCPTEAAALAIAGNNGVPPGGTVCSAVTGNSLLNFDVDNPYGVPGNDSPDLVDVPASGTADLFLVGKIAANGSCTGPRTNRVFDLQWGCEADPPAGGISIPASSGGIFPSVVTADAAVLSTVALPNGLVVQQAVTGTNTGQPVGSKGTVRLTITNNTGGTVRNIRLRDVLPAEYVVDPTFTPTVAMAPAYSPYPGMTDRLTWTNPAPGTFPLTTVDPALPLGNTAPEFELWSSTVHPVYADQFNMMRHGDVLTVTFRIVLIRPASYDKSANLDVRTEAPDSDPALTDPTHVSPLRNEVYVDFNEFCQPTVNRRPAQYPLVRTNITADPEDLDVDIVGSELVFILTGDPQQRLPLTVAVTNNGGHDATDYATFVTFGRTMNVVSAPAGCTLTSNPPPLAVWREPAPIPADASVYRCTGSRIAPGRTVPLTFEVVKRTDPTGLAADDLTFRADTVGEITLSDGTPLWFPTPTPRSDGVTDRANNYSLDGIRARVIGFNLLKSQVGTCTENNPPPMSPDRQVQIGEECTFHIDTGGWFGFRTPGFTYIAVQDIQVVDQLPDGQGYLASTDPYATSTSAIRGIGLNPAGLTPPAEVASPEWLNWTFNRLVPAERITEKDHWFRVDMTSRLLNDPIDLSAPPNRHAALSSNILNSFFQAVYYNDSTNQEEIYHLGPNTVGYPREAVRRVDLTVTEPHLTLVKEVCNETLYGAGSACSNFVPLAEDGDAYNSYIYRLTIVNEAENAGVQRAPAYDVIVTDRLDASDLAYLLPFAGDGLDNDGDGATGAADADGEGAVSDNTVRNGIPAQITFSHTHSSALRRIDPGESVRLYYRVDYDDDAAPLQGFTNTAEATYDSLAGVSGNQSAPQRPNGDLGGARLFTSQSASATVRILPVETRPKRVVRLANTPLAAPAATQEVSIGEEIEYQLNTLLPVALLRNLVIRDELPAGLRCIDAPILDLGPSGPYAAAGFVPGGSVTPTCTGQLVEWSLGDQRVTRGTTDNRYDFAIGFIARVDNSAGVNDGEVIANGAPATGVTARYIDEAGQPVVHNFAQVEVLVREPQIALTKAFAVAEADAGDLLTVTVTATNNGAATAYNLRLLDDLSGRNLTFAGGVGGIDPPDSVDTASLGANRPIFSWSSDAGIPPGGSRSFTFQVRVDSAAQPHELLQNTVQAVWSSLPGRETALNGSGRIGEDGAETGMRIGTLPHSGDAVNDYESVATASLQVPAAVAGKTDLDPAVVPAIGAHKRFSIEIALPEGTTREISVADHLDAGSVSYVLTRNADFDVDYQFIGIASINGQVPTEAAFLTFPGDATSGTAVWNIGDVVTAAEDDLAGNAIEPRLVITYYGRVNNDLVTDRSDALRNDVTVSYRNGRTAAAETLSGATAAVTVVEPLLAASKTMVPGGTALGGDLLLFTVTIANNGDSTAYEVNIVDALPAGMVLQSGTEARLDGTPVAGFQAEPAVDADGNLVWGRGNGDHSLTIPAGRSLVLTYTALVAEGTGEVANTVWVDWTSLGGASGYERTGAGCPAITAPNDYCVTATYPLTVAEPPGLTKFFVADSFVQAGASTADDGILRIGDTVTYRVELQLPPVTLGNVQVEDLLPPGMVLVEVVSIDDDTTAPYAPAASSVFAYAPIPAANVPPSGATGRLLWDLGQITHSGDQPATLAIVYRAQVISVPELPHQPALVLSNSASLHYTQSSGEARTQIGNAVPITVWQPSLTVAKTVQAAGGDSVVTAGEMLTYTVELTNGGTAPAYDTLLTDTLPAGLRQGGVTTTGLRLVDAGIDLPALAPAYDPATGVVTWDLATGASGTYAIPAGETLRLVYQVAADAAIGSGVTLTNLATVSQYFSLDATVDGRRRYGPSDTAAASLSTAPAGALAKRNPEVPTAAVGEPFTYQIVVPAVPHATALYDVRVLDDLGAAAADLRFVGVSKISGSGSWTPVNTGTLSQLVIEDPVAGIDIPAGEQIVLGVTVVLTDAAENVNGLQFTNTASYTYDSVDGDSTTRTEGDGDTTAAMTIIGPETLTLEKSGPLQMEAGEAAPFVLAVHNPGGATAWNLTLTDRLPAGDQGGMCDAPPTDVSAQIFAADGETAVSPLLAAGTDFVVNFEPAACQWRLSFLTPAAALAPGERLIVRYEALLDADTQHEVELTNVAGVTEWYGAAPGAVPGAAPRLYSRALTDGTPGTLDHEDAHTVRTGSPVLLFQKSVQNLTTGQNPGIHASPGDTLRYTLRVTNLSPGTLASFPLVDELDRLNEPAVFAPGSLVLISIPEGADASASSAVGGGRGTGLVDIRNLAIGGAGTGNETIEVVFAATLAQEIASGTVLRNQAEIVTANPIPYASDDPNVNGPDDPSLPGDEDPTATLVVTATLTGSVWHDANLDKLRDAGERGLEGWSVELYRDDQHLATALTDADGNYRLVGVVPNEGSAAPYELRFRAAGAGPETAALGYADSPFTNGPQRIDDITVPLGGILQNLNLPISPNGVVYDSVRRVAVAGARLALLNAATNTALPERCFDDPAQQHQVTPRDGFYKFDLNFSDPSCPPGAAYFIEVTPLAGFLSPSVIIPPAGDASSPFSVPACPGSADNGDALPGTAEYCEVTASASAPDGSVRPRSEGTLYHLHLTLSDGLLPGQSQLFNNHIPVDSERVSELAIHKTSSLLHVTRGQLVPYTITVENKSAVWFYDLGILDRFPAGFKYVAGSARLDGQPREPRINGRELLWDSLELPNNARLEIRLLLVPGAAVAEGEYVNRAQVINTASGGTVSGEATATVRIVPDPTFDCTDVIGKVFDDRNRNGRQEPDEDGLSGVRVVTARGLIATTDQHGRFHLTCAVVPDEDRGSNFILKLDDRSLPTGYRLTTENPRVERATRGKMLRFNFGATLHRVVAIDLADGAFEPDTTELRLQWAPKVVQLIGELKKGPAVLRLSYLADVEGEGLVRKRLQALKKEVARAWSDAGGGYRLDIETEVFWRRGGPP